jgi:hypothetical protein
MFIFFDLHIEKNVLMLKPKSLHSNTSSDPNSWSNFEKLFFLWS